MGINEELQNALNIIKRNQKFLILPSTPPDGDSIGSTLALFFVLKKLGKEVTAVCHDPIPNIYEFLHPRDYIKENISINRDFIVTLDSTNASVDHIRYEVEHNKVNIVITPKVGDFTDKDVTFHHGPVKYDVIVTVDTGDLQQLGPIYANNPEIFYTVPVINIDHHASNSYFGRVNIIDITAASTTEILYQFIKELSNKMPLFDEDIATSLLAGIITDTSSFQNANTTPKSLEISSELVIMGARQQEIIKNVYKTKQLSTLKLWGRVLSKIHTDRKYKIIWSVIESKDFQETESHPDEVGSIIDDLLTNDPDAEVILLLKEKKKGLISGSIRTTTNAVDASHIAEMFGGGGHPRASGFRVESTNIHEVENRVIQKIKEYQHQRLFGESVPFIDEAEEKKTTPILEKTLTNNTQISGEKDIPSKTQTNINKHTENKDKHREEQIKKLTQKFFSKEKANEEQPNVIEPKADTRQSPPIEFHIEEKISRPFSKNNKENFDVDHKIKEQIQPDKPNDKEPNN
ncbi:hypothetical protein A2483_00520 [Candidatus Peregrinibacteria bacterium RIFOXYC2_FULL_33_13]|nr:MAG: MgpA protein [Candidatus Peregrinibacteria bacterium GW2011_GWA2_33_10]KKP39007.1 MAG: MgpA protein, phosphoesterase RecJ domain-containing protein [Candidatus Peregrinibacteria bacterium GW2011_GWC2_33_13]OGJ52541.1 MAG: hypothetical protein A2483_00520 [Candidatus Peregrinibacteria bacterium RIFOXYC2_FULL_33_13]